MSTDHDEIEAIRARWAEATPGPWCWEGTFSSHGIRLVSPSSRVRPSRLVMGFERWGMSRASPLFQLPDLTVRAAREISVRHPKYLNDINALNHPTAIAIAAAPADVQTLLRVVDAQAAELKRQRSWLVKRSGKYLFDDPTVEQDFGWTAVQAHATRFSRDRAREVVRNLGRVGPSACVVRITGAK